jgi:hypothetical protein
MPIFDTLSQLDNYIINVTNKEIADYAGKLAVRITNEVILDTVYHNPSSFRGGSYENTYGLMDSATSNIYRYGSGVVDTGQMVDVTITPKGDYPSHPLYTSLNNNNNDKIVEWLNYRTKGGMYKGFSMKPPNYLIFDKARARLVEGGLLKSYVQNFLKARSYVISKRSL